MNTSMSQHLTLTLCLYLLCSIFKTDKHDKYVNIRHMIFISMQVTMTEVITFTSSSKFVVSDKTRLVAAYVVGLII